MSGALLPFAFAPHDVFPLAVLCPALLFYLWLRAAPPHAFRLGFLFGLGCFGVGVRWLYISINQFGGVTPPGAVAVTAIMVLILALYPAAVGWFVRRFAPHGDARSLVGAFPAAWVLSEWVRGWMFTGFPWLLLGYSQTDSPLRGLAPALGVLGVSWTVGLLAGLVVLIGSGRGRRWACIAALLAVLLLSWSADRQRWTRDDGAELSVALVQGAVPLEMKWRAELRQQSIDRYVSLSDAHWGRDIILWPETAIPAFQHELAAFFEDLRKRAQDGRTDFYVGVPVMASDSNAYFNSVVLLGEQAGTYHKRHLVPFGEYLPFKHWLGRLFDFLDIPMSDFARGDRGAKPLLAGNHAVSGVSICYEDAFGSEIRRALPDAEILINVSNDAWFGDSAAPHQHLQIARMRAMETGRYLLRATNSGISAVIDDQGTLLSRSELFVPAVVTAQVRRKAGLTPYARFGDLPLLLSCAGLLVYLCRRRERSVPIPDQ